jgi:hypothetical protein
MAELSTPAQLLAALGLEAEAPSWDLRTAGPVPMARWGKDHWTTFAYAETRWVDHRGQIDAEQMRCDRHRHPMFYLAKRRTMAFGTDNDGARYATRLKSETPGPDGRWGIVEMFGHDDWNCLDDAVTEGLIEVTMPAARLPHNDIFQDAWGRSVQHAGKGELISPGFVTGLDEAWLMTAAQFSLTERGQVIAGQLRAHMAGTRQSHQFVPEEMAHA